MPFLTNDPLPQCLQTSSDIALSPPIGNKRGCGRYLLEVKCLVTDPGTVELAIPPRYRGRVAELMTDVEQLAVEPDTPARILIDERSGIIVIGDDVRISKVAVAQGNLTVRVSENPQVSQPNPLGQGQTKVVPRTK